MERRQLSGIDASFLYLKTPEIPMHVAGSPTSSFLQSLVNQLSTLNARRTPFNATITRERSHAARTISLSDAEASGAKLNDVVLAVCSGALRRYLQS